jgi:hypothetical protein
MYISLVAVVRIIVMFIREDHVVHMLRLFNARDIAYIYWGVKQRYDGKISCEYIPVNRGKASEAGAKI